MRDNELTPQMCKDGRKAARLSQGRLAAAARCSQAAVSAFELGFGHPSPKLKERLHRALTDAGRVLDEREMRSAKEP